MVRATIHYVTNPPGPGEPMLTYVTEDEARSTMCVEPGVDVEISDVRGANPTLRREGFQLVQAGVDHRPSAGGDGGFDALCERLGPLALGGRDGRAERDDGPLRLGPVLALGQDAAGAGQVDRYHRHAALDGQVGGAASERLAPSVR